MHFSTEREPHVFYADGDDVKGLCGLHWEYSDHIYSMRRMYPWMAFVSIGVNVSLSSLNSQFLYKIALQSWAYESHIHLHVDSAHYSSLNHNSHCEKFAIGV